MAQFFAQQFAVEQKPDQQSKPDYRDVVIQNIHGSLEYL